MGATIPRIFRFDASGCNGCDVEVVEMTALFSLAELGVDIVESPAAANVLVVTGGANLKSKRELEHAYSALQAPRMVVAVGSCAASMGIFKGGYSMTGPIDAIIPVRSVHHGMPAATPDDPGGPGGGAAVEGRGSDGMLRTPEGFRGDPHVDQGKCIGCSACANVCPADAIEIADGGAVRVVRFMRHACVFCASCQDICPTKAVALRSGDASWFREKGASKSEATLPLASCRLCGSRFMPEAQIEWAMKTVGDKRTLTPADRVALQGRLSVCMACRRGRIPDVREAKRLLTP